VYTKKPFYGYDKKERDSVIKAGYKKTETGVSFGEIFEEMLTRKKIKGDDIVTFLGMQDLSEEASIIKQHQVLFSHVKSGFTYFERNDTLVAKITPCFENGKGAFLGELTTPIGFGSTEFHVLRAKDGNDPKYIYHHTRSDAFRKKLEKEMVGSAGHRRVPFVEIQKYWLPVKHNLAEQTAIAKALSDTDALIQSLSQLIAKKRQIKQGAMQNLLNPYDAMGALKVGWVVKKLDDIASFSKGKGLPKSELVSDGKYDCIHYGELFTKYKENINSILSTTNSRVDSFLSQVNDVLMPTSDVTPNGLATASCLKTDDVILGGDILVIRAYKGLLDGVFFAYLVNLERNQVMQLVTGSTVYHLYGSDMAKFKFGMPEKFEEQTKIAQILTDMDTEITTLETKLSKYQKIKQGMMQNLLTGRIRLVSE